MTLLVLLLLRGDWLPDVSLHMKQSRGGNAPTLQCPWDRGTLGRCEHWVGLLLFPTPEPPPPPGRSSSLPLFPVLVYVLSHPFPLPLRTPTWPVLAFLFPSPLSDEELHRQQREPALSGFSAAFRNPRWRSGAPRLRARRGMAERALAHRNPLLRATQSPGQPVSPQNAHLILLQRPPPNRGLVQRASKAAPSCFTAEHLEELNVVACLQEQPFKPNCSFIAECHRK